MVRCVALFGGFTAAVLWVLVADVSDPIRLAGALVVLAGIVGLGVIAARRSWRLRSDWEGYGPQVIRHDGGAGRRARRKDSDDPEFFVGDRW